MHIVSQGMQNTIAQHPQRREKVTWNLQFHCARKSNRNRRQSEDRRTRRANEPTFLRNGTSVYPKKHNVSCKSWHSNRIHDVAVPVRSANSDLQKTIRIARQHCRTSPLREALTQPFHWDLHRLSCTRVAQHNRITTHYCRTHRFDAAVRMHKVFQHMRNTIAQHPQRREKVTWNLQFHCARKSNRNRRQSEDRRTRRASEPTFLRNGISGYPKKHIVSCKSWHSNRIHDVTVPMPSAKNDLQNTIRIARRYRRTSTLR